MSERIPILTAAARHEQMVALGYAEIVCVRCTTAFKVHGLHWCAEVCGSCFQCYHMGYGSDNNFYVMPGHYDEADKASIRRNYVRHGGRYVPHFNLNDPDACGTICGRYKSENA